MPSHYGKGRSKAAGRAKALAAQKRKKVGAPGVSGEAPELKAHGVKPSK